LSAPPPQAAAGTCESCATFNQADVDNVFANGWNAIRLSVVWAGAAAAPEISAETVRRCR
jgi:hypothetical protein